MEITEANAQNINDVYSNLAAKTASNVDEISTAMTKVASLANNANMSFENTAAFLSQIIETTRESAETAGTALKTVIARFSEVKSLYSEGELLGTDTEGEEINVNKISTALRTAGINLNEYLTGMKGLDEIFMELSAKWDGLDQVQQRYIATMAAGSRQQSRFIALMQDNARMTELVKEANNAAGASQEQFQKTLDSLETKLNQLKNAWDTFLMGLANNELIKGAIDLLTQLLTAVNDLTKGFSGTGKSIASLGIAFGGFKLGHALLAGLTKSLSSSIFKPVADALGKGVGDQLGKNGKKFLGNGLSKSLQDSIKSIKTDGLGKALSNKFKNAWKGIGTVEELGIKPNDFINVDKIKSFSNITDNLKNSLKSQLGEMKFDLTPEINETEVKTKIEGLIDNGSIKEATEEVQKYGQSWQITGEVAQEAGAQIDADTKRMNTLASASAATGAALMALSMILESTGVISDKTAKYVRIIAIAFMALPVVLKVVEAAARVFSANVTASFLSIPIVGWIAAAITAITALIAVFVSLGNENSAEAKLEAATEAAEKAAEAANKAAEAYKNLNESFEGLSDKYKALEELTTGTQEWRDAVQDLNLEVLQLIKEYPELAKFVQNQGGVLKIDLDESGVQEVLARYQEDSIIMAANSAQAEIEKINSERNKLREDLDSAVLVESFYQFEGLTTAKSKQDTDLVALALAGDSDTLKYFEEMGVSEIGKSREDFAEALINATGSFNNSGLAMDALTDVLTNYGNTIKNGKERIEGFYKALSADIIQVSNLTEEEKKYAAVYLSEDRIKDLYTNEKDWVDRQKGYLDNNNDEWKDYWDKRGYSIVDNQGKVRDRQTGEELEADDARLQYATYTATKIGEEWLNSFLNIIKDSNTSKEIKKVYEASEGNALSQKDIDNLKNMAVEDLIDLIGVDETQKIYDAIKLSEETHEKAISQIKDEAIKSQFESLGGFQSMTAEAKKKISDEIGQVMVFSGTEGAETLMKSLSDVYEKLGEEDKDKFMNALNFDWSDLTKVEDFSKVLEEMGVSTDVAESEYKTFIDNLVKYAGSLEKVNIKQLLERIEKLNSLRGKLAKGEFEGTVSKEEYEALIEGNPELENSFIKNLEGQYVYVGNSMDNLRTAVEDLTGVMAENTKTLLDRKIAAAGVLEGLKGRELEGGKKIDFENLNEADESTKKAFLQEVITTLQNGGFEEDLKNFGIGLSKNSNIDTIMESGQLDATIAAVLAFINNRPEFEADRKSLNKDPSVSTMLTKDANYLAEHIDDEEGAKEALLAQAQAAKISEEAYTKYATKLEDADEETRKLAAAQMANLVNLYDEAEALGIDTEELEIYANQLRKTNGLSIENAHAIALANTKLNKGLAEIISSYKDWTLLIGKNGKLVEINNSDDIETFNKLKISVQKMLNTTVDLSDEFWNSKENLAAIKAAAEGDVEALEKLQKAAAIDYIVGISVDLPGAEEDVDKLIKFINTVDIPKLEAGVELTGKEEFIQSIWEMVTQAGMGVDQIKALFTQLGFHVEIGTKEQTDWSEYTEVIQEAEDVSGSVNARMGGGRKINFHTVKVPSTIRVPFIEKITSTGSGGGGISHSNQQNGQSNKPKSSSSKKDSGSKPSYWKNPYDELFNLQEKINEALRQREALERRYDKLLKSEKASVSEIRKGYFDQIKALREEINLQQQLQAGRKRQIQNLGSETYTDKDGNRRTFSSLGVTKYAKYDFNTGRITIDWEGLEKIARDSSRTAEGEAAEAYINKLQELVDSYEETRDAIWDFEDKIEDLMKEAIDSYTSFEDRVKDALVNQYQKEIDTLQAMSDAVTEATNKIIDSIQEQIEAERRERQNQKTEQDIADKEARLAYLRRDTSGANELQIRQLEKELEEARQSYEDTLIDQTLDQMRKDADLAAEQRQMQIDIMQEQFQQSIDTGKIWNEVWALMQKSIAEDGTLDFNSALIKMLQESEVFKALSSFGQDEWIKDLVEAFHRAIEGLAAGGATEFGQHENSGAASGGSSGGSAPTSGTPTTGGGTDTSTSTPAPTPKSSPYGLLPSQTEGTLKKGSRGNQVKTVQWALNELGYRDKNGNRLEEDGIFGAKTEYALTQFQKAEGLGPNGLGIMGKNTRSKFALHGYAKGGLADFTGPAWLDGTKSNPELILSARDTENFITLKDILADMFGAGGTASTKFGDTYIDIDVNADIGSDYDVDRLVEELKSQIVRDSLYRNVTPINFMR